MRLVPALPLWLVLSSPNLPALRKQATTPGTSHRSNIPGRLLSTEHITSHHQVRLPFESTICYSKSAVGDGHGLRRLSLLIGESWKSPTCPEERSGWLGNRSQPTAGTRQPQTVSGRCSFREKWISAEPSELAGSLSNQASRFAWRSWL